MGNISGGGGGGARRRQGSRRSHPSPPPPPHTPQPEFRENRYVFAAAMPYPNPSAGYYQYNPPAGYYPPLPAPYDHHHPTAYWAAAGRYPCGPVMPSPAPYVEHQKAVTIRHGVNLKKETLRVEPDEENPGKYLVAFTFDASLAGRNRLDFC